MSSREAVNANFFKSFVLTRRKKKSNQCIKPY